MASKRRGGFRPPELRGTLGTLLRTTTGVVRDAFEQGRARLDSARASRRRHDALADLGELVLDLIRRGEIDHAELPEARDLIRELDELDDGPDTAAAAEPAPAPPRPAARRRFDDRARGDRDDSDGTVASGAAPRSGRPTVPDRPTAPDGPPPADTTPSRTPTRPLKPSPRPSSDEPSDRRGRIERWDAAHTFPINRSELGVPAERAAEPPAPNPERERSDRRPAPPPRDPDRKGGISFDDEDLADYMHPDDVPPKPTPSDPDDHGA